MRPWCIAPSVGKIHILGNQEPTFALGDFPDGLIETTFQAFIPNGLDVVPKECQPRGKTSGQILIEFDLHRIWGMAGTGRSSSADAAAKAITARMSSGV